MSKLKCCGLCCGLFKCHCFAPEEEEVQHIYDNITSDVWDTQI